MGQSRDCVGYWKEVWDNLGRGGVEWGSQGRSGAVHGQSREGWGIGGRSGSGVVEGHSKEEWGIGGSSETV